MPSLKDIKRRIKSVKNTRQITKAMKMVSAAKLKKAQDEITAARPYAEKMLDLINSLASKASPDSHPLLEKREVKNVSLALFTSDRGLCGSFNSQLLRTAERFLRERGPSGASLYLVGKRGAEYYKRRNITVLSARPVGSGRPSYGAAVEIANDLVGAYLKGETDEVHMVFSEFKSALTQKPLTIKLLPVAAPDGEEAKEDGDGKGEYIYEPGEEAVLASLLPKYVEVQAFRALLETSASEHGARMTAMDSASKNAGQMISGLTLVYNRLRQAAITKELMEIIGGAEALK